MLQKKSQWDQSDDNYDSSPPEGVRDFDIQLALDRLEEKIIDNPRIPFFRRTLIDEDDILAQIDFIRVTLPVAMQKAEDIIAVEKTIVRQAEERAKEIIGLAQQQASQMMAQTEIVRQAEREANQLRQRVERECHQMQQEAIAQLDQIRQTTYQELEEMRQMTLDECDEIQQGADDYADQVLTNIENQLTDMLNIIQNGRKQLTIDS